MLLPSLVYCPTDRCDMRCQYCPTEGNGSYGENFEISHNPLEPEEVVWAANVIGGLGFKTFRLTGGEPLLDIPRTVKILRGVVEAGQFSDTRLNTNGSRLAIAAPALREIPFTALKVSLDTLDPNLFFKVTKSRRHSDVLKGIEAAKAVSLPVEVNAVLTSDTEPGMMDLVHWCQSRGISLKILDLVRYASQANGYFGESKAGGLALDRALREIFGTPETVQLNGQRGIFMKRYGSNPYVLFKDCKEGTTYTNYCHGCPHFPCEEGIHHLSMSTDGHLRPCRIRNNVFWDLRPLIVSLDDVGLRNLVKFLLETHYTGEFSAAPVIRPSSSLV